MEVIFPLDHTSQDKILKKMKIRITLFNVQIMNCQFYMDNNGIRLEVLMRQTATDW